MTTAPVLFQIFNRPEVTARTFEAIRAARPPTLLIVADGPRPNRPGEAERCARTRAIAQAVDWPCEVLLNLSDVNLGCGKRVSSGFDWAFTQVESAIILEDDCLPDPTFFRFCSELLERYRDEERIMMISGDNFQNGASRTTGSYYFSRFSHCWGWATWRRAWRHYDYAMKGWPERRDTGWLKPIAQNGHLEMLWTSCFEGTRKGRIDSWDYQWLYCLLAREGLSIVPDVNLVTNIGFGEAATHTTLTHSRYLVPRAAMAFPLSHPAAILPHEEADLFEKRYLYKLDQLTWIDRLRPHCGPLLAFLRPRLERMGLWPHIVALVSRLQNRESGPAQSLPGG